MDTHFDVAIVGGGAVGSSLALALAKCDFNVALIDERDPFSRCDAKKDNRIFALATGTHFILDRLGVWQQLVDKVCPIQHIHASNRGSFGAVRLHAKDYDSDALGYMLASVDLQQALNDVVATTNITQFFPARFEALTTSNPSHITFTSDSGEQCISADLVVAADGAQSSVRKQLGIGSSQKAFGQHALVSTIVLEQEHQDVAYERFVDDGAIALLPYGDKTCALIWSLSEEDAAHYQSMTDEVFLVELQRLFGYRLGKLASIGKRMSYPLVEIIADSIVHNDQVVFVGNASQSLHPVAAQGFNLALRNVALLVDCLLKTKEDDLPLAKALEVFANEQKQDQQRTRCFTNGLVQFFANDGPTKFKSVRGLALLAFDLCPPAKRHLIRGMMKGVERLAHL